MILVEYIINNNSLLNIIFDREILKHINASVDDHLNFFQSVHNVRFLTLFKSDSGYRIIRVPEKKKLYQVNIRHKLLELNEFNLQCCTYYLKNNGIIKLVIK